MPGRGAEGRIAWSHHAFAWHSHARWARWPTFSRPGSRRRRCGSCSARAPESWVDNGWLRAHTTGKKEIAGLLSIVDRDLADAGRRELCADWRFGIAYNAALKPCTILVHASGYRPERTLHHYRTLQALPLVLGPGRQDDADYLEACRVKRNTVEYDMAGAASAADADELLEFASRLRGRAGLVPRQASEAPVARSDSPRAPLVHAPAALE